MGLGIWRSPGGRQICTLRCACVAASGPIARKALAQRCLGAGLASHDSRYPLQRCCIALLMKKCCRPTISADLTNSETDESCNDSNIKTDTTDPIRGCGRYRHRANVQDRENIDGAI